MRAFIQSRLECEADLAWSLVQTSKLLQEVMAPLVILRPRKGETFAERWPAGRTVMCRCFLFGVIPLGTRSLHFERIDSEAREIQTRESDPLVRRWDHLIRITPTPDHACRYSDEIEIDAGWRTFFVWWFANVFYRHRQRRWRKLLRRLAGERKTINKDGPVGRVQTGSDRPC